jgi:Fur family transcriptional regulator, peroxide stress response regulator
MGNIRRSEKLRALGLKPTIQRLAVLEYLEDTKSHPTADAVLAHVQKKHPTISRATVYNTLEALTRSGVILRITVDPSVARYDADLGPHAHFRCRICNKVYDVIVDDETPIGEVIEGHHVETVRTYAYGVCSTCLAKGGIEHA